ncbi:type II toxin-antitoxin system PemK/MazF family toxin [Fusobacterium polymorphum]|uniref:type II toxin-antitoxin system PemK/MazF family toxin n=1 Tax=Fusobacterium nucleatum subsp. polymorphum TaxID=76857 RepID=UPI001C6DFB84|nr:type II toxin-antitoxin system PemK/MazF family toxin [Fusobacterium polymorphum]QYR58890.1 type II toxin-antitoxin system PemK/MazF family toxin [Fusobacterium polymorphum]DAF25541.1 MAG TPA: PemK-like protein [Caudoviricetes sp.]
MTYDILGVYLVDFKANNIGGEMSGKHYALILSELSKKDYTLLAAPITSKKAGKKYRGGFTIDCTKYQKNPTHKKAFVKIRKMREISKSRIYGDKIYDLDVKDKEQLQKVFQKFFSFLDELDDIQIKAEGTF